MTNYSCARQKSNQVSKPFDEIRQVEPTMDRSKFADLIGTILEEECYNESINTVETGEAVERTSESFVVTRELFNTRFMGLTRLLRILVFINRM